MEEQKNTYENVTLEPDVGFDIRFVTMDHNSPFHWHREMEILYILNGHATVHMEGEEYELNPLDAVVMDYARIHEVIYALPEPFAIRCAGQRLRPGQQEYYNEICGYLKELTVLYVNQNETYRLKSTARILELLACLVEHFSEPVSMVATQTRAGKMERLEQICMYVDHHYREEMTLQEAADELGLNREYFCRFFKQSTGSSFMRYVNQVRLNYIYQDLLHTDDPVQEIMERHGFFNQKLFYRMFKERYHCTPRQARRMAENNPYVEAK